MLRRLHAIIFATAFLGAFVINTFLIGNVFFGAFLLLLYVGGFGWEVGGIVTQSEKAILRWWLGIWILLSTVLSILAASYYLWMISAEVIWAVITLTPPLLLILAKHVKHPSIFAHGHNLWRETYHKIPSAVWIVGATVALLLTLFFSTLADSQVTDAVRSIWERLPSGLFILFFLACALTFALLWRGKERALSLTLVSALVLATITVVAIAFPVGYGFDSFIHKATEGHLAQYGTISPKPFYYIGQYALVLLAHHGFLIPIDIADTFLVPILAALLLPMAWYYAAVHILRKKRVASMTLMGLFLLPLSQFIVTTPQALANLWTLLLILASVPYLLEHEHPRLRALVLGAVATTLIHPIAGIPALLYFMFLATDPSRTNPRTPVLNRVTRALLILFASIVLPLSFVVNAFISGQPLGINWSALDPITWLSSLNLTVFFENRFDPLLDLVYLYGLNAGIILLLLAGFAWVEYRKELSRRFRAVLLMILTLSINYFILSGAIDFTFLIDYERSNYAARLIPLISFFLAPYIILALGHALLNLRSQPIILRAGALLLLVTIATSSLYMTYPRRDAYQTNRGFNVGQADIDAVHLVESLADGKPYVALANQSVSAAAIHQIGFHYFDELFFYPIPTGGELYEQFLIMNELPTREGAQNALSLVAAEHRVKRVYFLVNNYWWQAPRIIETAKASADDWRAVGESGQVHVFEYIFE